MKFIHVLIIDATVE